MKMKYVNWVLLMAQMTQIQQQKNAAPFYHFKNVTFEMRREYSYKRR